MDSSAVPAAACPGPAGAGEDAAPDTHTCWYFAIGSMINPVSISLRDVHPIVSHPGEILDYKLEFLPSNGMAEAVSCKGASFHGVLHQLSVPDMQKLDEIEAVYAKDFGNIRLYDGTIVNACVYCVTADMRAVIIETAANAGVKLPTERYIDIIVRGCRHHGVAEAHIEYLLSLENVPRKAPADFEGWPVPQGLATWTIEDIHRGMFGEEYVIIAISKIIGDFVIC
jgi:hypothetical protein